MIKSLLLRFTLFFYVILLFLSRNALASGVEFELNRVKLPDAISIIYSEIFKRPYMLSPDLANDERLLTLRITKEIDEQQFIERYFSNMNIKIWDKNGVDYIAVYTPKPTAQPTETFIYTPKYRSVSYLSDILSSQVQGVFNSQGTISNTSQTSYSSGDVNPNSASGQFSRSGDVLVYRGTKADIKLVKQLLPKIDTVTDEILVTGYVVEVSTTKQEGNGLSFIANLLDSKLGVQVNSNYNPLTGNLITFSSGSFSALVELFNKDNHFKVISSPQLRVKNGSNASFSVGSDVPVLGSTTYQDGKPIQSIEYRSSGVLFDIRSEIRLNTIDLTIQQQLSNFVKTETGINNSPTLIKRDVNTQVSIKSGEIIVLGGLAETKNGNHSTGFTLLPFLKSSGKENNRTDIVVILHVEKIEK
ncbi:secretin [Gilliamella sp. Occ3-1]|uniref:type II secretion system protein GspD n=1 Tax=Gilliamella sp. Occ3-1 TaxID=3120253 RepID=UPI00080DCC8D|nr:secretin [Gilliamella apicola]OCG70671.1 secretin [Gilliamella apicola]